MGRNHVRILKAMDLDVTTVDPNGGDIASIAELGPVDVAVVASPSTMHAEHAVELLDRGVHVLIEKPLAMNAAECQAIAEAGVGKVVAVGHVERFNPAIRELGNVRPELLSIERLSLAPWSTDAVTDLMVHDIDLACELMEGEPDRVTASLGFGHATASLTFGDRVANLTASLITHDKVRRVSVTEIGSYTVADLVAGTVTRSQLRNEGMERGTYSHTSEITVTECRGDALTDELTDFLEAVRIGRQPRVGLDDGTRAVRIAAQMRGE